MLGLVWNSHVNYYYANALDGMMLQISIIEIYIHITYGIHK